MDIGSSLQWLPLQEIRKVSASLTMFLFFHGIKPWILLHINMGGDDFVTKPFDQNVLLVKVHVSCAAPMSSGRIKICWSIEEPSSIKSMKLHEGEVINLTKNEFQILRVLFEHAGSIVARDDMMKEL